MIHNKIFALKIPKKFIKKSIKIYIYITINTYILDLDLCINRIIFCNIFLRIIRNYKNIN